MSGSLLAFLAVGWAGVVLSILASPDFAGLKALGLVLIGLGAGGVLLSHLLGSEGMTGTRTTKERQRDARSTVSGRRVANVNNRPQPADPMPAVQNQATGLSRKSG